MEHAHDILIRSLQEHSRLAEEDVAEISALSATVRKFDAGEDIIRQGDVPDASALLVSGMLARYHLLATGGRQYLSFHMAGDLPDAQALFVDRMDHSVCAMGKATVAFLPHRDLLRAFERRPSLAFAIWRETLLDAAIFREAITNNSARPMPTRMAHLFCELHFRARASHLVQGNSCHLPISLIQLGEALGMSIATVNRSLHQLRAAQVMDFRDGELVVLKWPDLQRIGDFNPDYLHLKKP